MKLLHYELTPLLSIERGYWYIATPYTKYPGGIEEAFKEACRFTAGLIQYGIPAYSPIAHTHPIAVHGGLDPLDHSIWLPADEPMMKAAHGLIVATMPTWEESYGVSVEINIFAKDKKPIHYISPKSVK